MKTLMVYNTPAYLQSKLSPPRPSVHSQRDRFWSSEIAKLNIIISRYDKENEKLEAEIDNITDSMLSPQKRKLCIKEFNKSINELTTQIEIRRQQLEQLHQKVTLFRIESPDSNLAKRAPRSYFSPSTGEPLKAEVKEENMRLSRKALYLERLLIEKKMQLRLRHDHRDLSELRDEIEGFSEENDERNENIRKLRETTKVLKRRIAAEKVRIQLLMNPNQDHIDAAVQIQKVWRGYCIRMKRKNTKS